MIRNLNFVFSVLILFFTISFLYASDGISLNIENNYFSNLGGVKGSVVIGMDVSGIKDIESWELNIKDAQTGVVVKTFSGNNTIWPVAFSTISASFAG